jgi:hypothetical protein
VSTVMRFFVTRPSPSSPTAPAPPCARSPGRRRSTGTTWANYRTGAIWLSLGFVQG